MISIIICSRTAGISLEQRSNIDSTIGCEHEIVVIDNSRGQHSIFQAYNLGVKRAKGEILCFMHDDVVFATNGWGNRITHHFADPTVGVIGFAGTHFVPDAPLYWYIMPFVSQYHQNNGHGAIADCICTDYFRGDLADVVEVDGLCMMVRASLFEHIAFDEKTYSGFHAYDIDLCMQVIALGSRVCICRDVMPIHTYSEASASKKKGMKLFHTNLALFQQKWHHMLPIWRGIELPADTVHRLNNLCAYASDAYVARHSVSYKLGHTILFPVKWFRNVLFHKKSVG